MQKESEQPCNVRCLSSSTFVLPLVVDAGTSHSLLSDEAAGGESSFDLTADLGPGYCVL